MDFNTASYYNLLETLLRQGFSFNSLGDYVKSSMTNQIFLRHDVDLKAQNSLDFAKIQAEIGVQAIYFFRIVPESFDENIIKMIYSLGHEVGYHYEDLSFAYAKFKAQDTIFRKALDGKAEHHPSQSFGWQSKVQSEELERKLVDIGIESFKINIERLRRLVPVKTICMHGSPMSRWDSRLLWKYYDYCDFGIKDEPYFDMDFSNMLYLTDTGRRWNGGAVSVRDKVSGVKDQGLGIREKVLRDSYENWSRKPIQGSLMNPTSRTIKFQAKYNFRSTHEIIHAAEKRELPDKIMMTFHPQRWTDKSLPWIKELVWQNVKNVGKYFLISIKRKEHRTIK